jgi:hypothetical protein
MSGHETPPSGSRSKHALVAEQLQRPPLHRQRSFCTKVSWPKRVEHGASKSHDSPLLEQDSPLSGRCSKRLHAPAS